jgi:hypothetical protein
MSGDVDMLHVRRHHVCAATSNVAHGARDGFFVAGNHPRREDHRIVRAQLHKPMIVDGDT